MRRTLYHVAGESLLVETQDTGIADEIDARFAGWHLARDDDGRGETPAIVIGSLATPSARIPSDWERFEIADGGTCHTDGRASYLEVDGAVIAIGRPGGAGVEAWIDTMMPLDGSALTRVVSYALSAALRQHRRFELHSGALVDPANGKGVLIVGPSGSGKSTLAVHLASAGWPFLTDDVLLLRQEHGNGARSEVTAWPLRRCFAITSDTFAASHFLQTRTSLAAETTHVADTQVAPKQVALKQVDVKQQFLPEDVFAGPFAAHCVPGTLVFAELTGMRDSRISRLSSSETMTRLIRMNPWSCYDRSTATHHLAVLSALATQTTAYALQAGRDLLDSDAAVETIAACTRAS